MGHLVISEAVWKISLKSLSNARSILHVNKNKETSNTIMTFLLIQIVRNKEISNLAKKKEKGEEAVVVVKRNKRIVLRVNRRKQTNQ